MKAVVFAVLFGLSSVASAACQSGWLWDDRCNYDYAPEVPALEAEKPPVDRMPKEQAFFFNDNPQDKAAPIPNGPGCWGEPWPCGPPR